MEYTMKVVREMIFNKEFANYIEQTSPELFTRLLNYSAWGAMLEPLAEITWGCWELDNALLEEDWF